MSERWSVHAYRRLCVSDSVAKANRLIHPSRFEHAAGSETAMRSIFVEYTNDPRILAVELKNSGHVIDRFDRLVELLPQVFAADARTAILEPRLVRERPH